MAACSSDSIPKKGPSSATKTILRIPHSKIKKLGIIGKGGFGSVFKVQVTSTELPEFLHPVAIKNIANETDPGKKRIRFFHEALNLNRFSHLNIIRLLGISIDGPERLMLLEYMDWGSVDFFLLRHPFALSIGKLLNICSQIASGVAHLASKDFIHGDLAGRNVFINSKFEVKIGDFGLSQNVSKNQRHHLKLEGIAPIAWLAPECFFGGENSLTKRSDVWSFGVVMWEVFSHGMLPFEHESPEMIMYLVLNGERLPRPFNCPIAVMKLLHSCWAQMPEDRITMEEVLQELKCLELVHKFMLMNLKAE